MDIQTALITQVMVLEFAEASTSSQQNGGDIRSENGTHSQESIENVAPPRREAAHEPAGTVNGSSRSNNGAISAQSCRAVLHRRCSSWCN